MSGEGRYVVEKTVLLGSNLRIAAVLRLSISMPNNRDSASNLVTDGHKLGTNPLVAAYRN